MKTKTKDAIVSFIVDAIIFGAMFGMALGFALVIHSLFAGIQ